MSLLTDVRVAFDVSIVDRTGRLLVCEGAISGKEYLDPHGREVRFHPDALIPGSRWRTASKEEESEYLTGEHATFAPDEVALLDLREHLEPFRAYCRTLRPTKLQEFMGFGASAEEIGVDLKRNGILDALTLRTGGVARLNYLISVAPGIPGTTTGGLFVGLHLDTGDPFRQRRAIFNVGEEERMIVFCPTRVDLHYQREGVLDEEFEGSAHLGRKFLSENRDAVLLGLLVRPGEGYIASTRSLLHDGNTSRMTTFDWSLIFGLDFMPA